MRVVVMLNIILKRWEPKFSVGSSSSSSSCSSSNSISSSSSSSSISIIILALIGKPAEVVTYHFDSSLYFILYTVW